SLTAPLLVIVGLWPLVRRVGRSVVGSGFGLEPDSIQQERKSRPTRRARASPFDRECLSTRIWCSGERTTRAAGALPPGPPSDDSGEIGRFLLHGGSNRRAASQREAHHGRATPGSAELPAPKRGKARFQPGQTRLRQ